jgi:hypothetical protein
MKKILVWSCLSSALLLLLPSCSYYYSIPLKQGIERWELSILHNKNNIFIIHFGEQHWQLSDIVFDSIGHGFSARLNRVSAEHLGFFYKDPHSIVNRYPKYMLNPSQEVHLEINYIELTPDSLVFIPFESVEKAYQHKPHLFAKIASISGVVVGVVSYTTIIITISYFAALIAMN